MSELQDGTVSEPGCSAAPQRSAGGAPASPPRPALLARLGIARDPLLLCLLVELWILNVADLALTRYGLWLGFATESNGVMAYFLHENTFTAIVFKIGIVTAGALGLWQVRRRPAALAAAALLTVVFAAVVAYQAAWVASL
jgi:hypothetical protein